MAVKLRGRIPTVPEYYKDLIDANTDLLDEPKQCCPFHKEDTPSFSYDIRSGRWSCFGKCHAHGDVVDMHMRWYHLGSREEAENSLYNLYRVKKESALEKFINNNNEILISEEKVDETVTLNKAILVAGNNPDRWLQLDELMIEYPVDFDKINNLIISWRGATRNIFGREVY